MAAMKKIADSDDKLALIMEDDVCPSAGFNDLILDVVNHLPNKFDIIKLEDCGREGDKMPETAFPGNSWYLMKNPASSYCTAAYAVSKEGAIKYAHLCFFSFCIVLELAT